MPELGGFSTSKSFGVSQCSEKLILMFCGGKWGIDSGLWPLPFECTFSWVLEFLLAFKYVAEAFVMCCLHFGLLRGRYMVTKIQSFHKKGLSIRNPFIWILSTHLFGDFSLFPFFYATDGDTCHKLKCSFLQFRKSLSIF